jgi:hypothetical protein
MDFEALKIVADETGQNIRNRLLGSTECYKLTEDFQTSLTTFLTYL